MMSNAQSYARTASSRFAEVGRATSDPATQKLAEGLQALAHAVEALGKQQSDILQGVVYVSSKAR
jgi:hypothetical protein